jgi:hypothetical protein
MNFPTVLSNHEVAAQLEKWLFYGQKTLTIVSYNHICYD